jgi:hypothetical protein
MLQVQHDSYAAIAANCYVTVSTGSMCLKFQCLSVSLMNGMQMEMAVLLTVKVKVKA